MCSCQATFVVLGSNVRHLRLLSHKPAGPGPSIEGNSGLSLPVCPKCSQLTIHIHCNKSVKYVCEYQIRTGGACDSVTPTSISINRVSYTDGSSGINFAVDP